MIMNEKLSTLNGFTNGFTSSAYFKVYTSDEKFELIPCSTLNGAKVYGEFYGTNENILCVKTIDDKIIFITRDYDFDNNYYVYNTPRKADVKLMKAYLKYIDKAVVDTEDKSDV